jgi:hypothetical protein
VEKSFGFIVEAIPCGCPKPSPIQGDRKEGDRKESDRKEGDRKEGDRKGRPYG